MNSSDDCAQNGPESRPPLTFSHSTTTVPLNFSGAGRRTSIRDRYAAVLDGVTVQAPSVLSAVALV